MNLRTFLGLRPPVQLPLPLSLGTPQLAAQRISSAGSHSPVRLRDPDALQSALAGRLRERVRVEIHDNRSTMVSYRRSGDALKVRLHHMFLPHADALPDILADFVAGRGRKRADAGRWLDRWIKEHQQQIRPGAPPTLGGAEGRTHNLAEIFASLNQRFFGGTVKAKIGWGRAPRKGRRRTIKMGVYLHDHQQIRIHPALDRPDVPRYFVEFVVYHEMCHQVCPPEATSGGRMRVHTSAFRRRERLFPDRERALLWEKASLGKLLKSS